ncbi:MAG: hypothetical protein WDM96_00115 [Lacunisphaera sp.]
MKNKILLLAGLALAGTAFAQVNPAQPMMTGQGQRRRAPPSRSS